MKKKIKAFLKRHIDYRIIGEYYDYEYVNGVMIAKKKYKKKYYWKK